MRGRDVVVVGGSAGGLDALRMLLSGFSPDFPAPIFCVLHRVSTSLLPNDFITETLISEIPLPVRSAQDMQPFEPGSVTICPRDHHLYLEWERIRIERSPKEGLRRPNIDVLFRSAASVYGSRAIGVLLSGSTGTDGVPGLWQIKRRGGTAIVQDPLQAQYPEMPRQAIEEVEVDFVLSAEKIAQKLSELVHRPPTAAHGRRVLIVEDERIVAKNLEERLKDLEYYVVGSVGSGEQALDLATLKPDVVLMDIRLNGPMSGIQAAGEIWIKHQIPVVYVTAFADSDTLEAVKSNPNYYGYVVKPFHTEAIHAAIQLALSRREREDGAA